MKKKWTLKSKTGEVSRELAKALNINVALANILVERGISTYELAEQFFRPQMSDLHDPFLMKGMSLAVDRIIAALKNNEKILVYGDYDVDGTTAVATCSSFLQKQGANVEFYIPDRFSEGYGVSAKGIEYARQNQFHLLITLDCGIKSVDLIQLAQQHGIDVIICDHHLPGDTLPPALAILNPKQKDCHYPFKELCGCGIGYKLMCAIEQTLTQSNQLSNTYLDLVATAIAADIVPMTGENRVLTYYGLKRANEQPCFGLQALKKVSEFSAQFKVSDLVFIVAPRINAAGRMDDAKKAVELFTANSLEEAEKIASLININNTDRKEVDTQTTQEALLLLQQEDETIRSTVLYQSHWHKGIVGIVASRMIEHKYQPTIILTESNGKVTGSARSIPGLNLYEALSDCSEYLDNYGGHYFAAGLTLKKEFLPAFKTRFDEVVKKAMPNDEDFYPQIRIDAEISFADINENFFSIVEQMEPYGPDNLKPIFVTKNVSDYQGYSCVVKDKHLKYNLVQGKTQIRGIGFNQAHLVEILKSGPVDVVYTLEKNYWNNRTSIEMRVLDIRACVAAN